MTDRFLLYLIDHPFRAGAYLGIILSSLATARELRRIAR